MSNNKYFGLNEEELEDMGNIEESLMSYGESKVKQIGEMTEKDKGQFIEKTANEIKEQFSGLIGLLNEDNEINNIEDESVIKVLEESTEPENKVIDTRVPNMVKKDVPSRPFSNPYSSPLMEQIKSKEFPDVSGNYLEDKKIDLDSSTFITIE